MNLYLLGQTEQGGYDTYDAVVVAAKNEDEARKIRPDSNDWTEETYVHGSWASSPDKVIVILIGKAVKGTEQGVILSSFNAG